MLTSVRNIRRRALLATGALALFALFAASCELVGEGDLHVSNDLSGIGQDNTVLRAYAAEGSEAVPPAGYINLYIRGDDFGTPPSYGMDGYLYLVSTDDPCPESEGAPEAFELADVDINGIVTVIDGSVNQFVFVPDNASTRKDRWALIEPTELAGFPGEHLAHRCGTVTWN